MLVSVKKAAEELGVSSEHIRRMIRAGRWPCYRLGSKCTRIDPGEIRALGRQVAENQERSPVTKKRKR